MEHKPRLNLSQRLRERILTELQQWKDLGVEQDLYDGVIARAIEQIDVHLAAIQEELLSQRAAVVHSQEMKERREDLISVQAQTATVSINRDSVLFVADVGLMIEHMAIIDDKVLVLALQQCDPKVLARMVKAIYRVLEERPEDT